MSLSWIRFFLAAVYLEYRGQSRCCRFSRKNASKNCLCARKRDKRNGREKKYCFSKQTTQKKKQLSERVTTVRIAQSFNRKLGYYALNTVTYTYTHKKSMPKAKKKKRNRMNECSILSIRERIVFAIFGGYSASVRKVNVVFFPPPGKSVGGTLQSKSTN